MTEYSIPVTGELDLEINAELLFDENNSYTNGKDNNRYHQLAIYKATDSDGDYYVLHIYYRTYWQGEPEISEVWECETQEELVNQLYSYDAIAHLIGFPTGERYDEKQERLKQTITFHWKELMVNALKELGIKRPKGRRKNKPTSTIVLEINPKLKAKAIELNLDLTQLLEQAISEV